MVSLAKINGPKVHFYEISSFIPDFMQMKISEWTLEESMSLKSNDVGTTVIASLQEPL